MKRHITLRTSVVCLGFGGCVGFLYFLVCSLTPYMAFDYKNGPRTHTPLQVWLDAFGNAIFDFPFGYYGVSLGSGDISYFFNGLFWALFGSGLYALRLWRKHAG